MNNAMMQAMQTLMQNANGPKAGGMARPPMNMGGMPGMGNMMGNMAKPGGLAGGNDAFAAMLMGVMNQNNANTGMPQMQMGMQPPAQASPAEPNPGDGEEWWNDWDDGKGK